VNTTADTRVSFTPIRVGTMQLDHRLVVPPHSGGSGRLVEDDAAFERHCAYWVARVQGGAQWVGGGPTFVANRLIPGFDPTGVGAHGPGFFRNPMFVPRMGELMRQLHDAGGYGSVQFVQQGGMPGAPSATLSGYSDHRVPHVLNLDDIAWLIREYGFGAAQASEAGADALELHANHDDIIQWFLSPLTNKRTDGYGGSFENRRRFLREIVETMRDQADRSITIGLRLCLDEMIDGGYTISDCQRLLESFTADGTVDYFSLDVGGNWGRVSYIPPATYAEAEWASLCGEAKQATPLPVVYVGRVFSGETAERVIADGHADLVGMARATIADPNFINKTRDGFDALIRPCIGANDCIDRRTVEMLEFGCSSNPHAGKEHVASFPVTNSPRRILVVGGGPAGMETAALLRERGHEVTLWEAAARLGGQLTIAAQLRLNERYGRLVQWQQARLDELGVKVVVNQRADVSGVLGGEFDTVVIATGAVPRFPEIDGVELPHVHTIPDALANPSRLGRHVLVVSEDDRAAPLAVADHLCGLGHQVTLVFRTNAPSPLVGKYAIGAYLARLDEEGAVLIGMTRVVNIEPNRVTLANSYSNRRWTLDDVDSVVLATGSQSESQLFTDLRAHHPDVHIVGDAFAPRRVVFATRQAFELAALLH
jgi:2,4-dienoyl-CoA reductase-like NADH-dependent reductase (Old Yellow Enzyme family)/thioredoxin reductase